MTQKILTFSWNADGLRICETTDQTHANKEREGFLAKLFNKSTCLAPDFFADIGSRIEENQPMIVVFTTQEEAENETYFHADFLPAKMRELQYTQYYREKLKKVGTHVLLKKTSQAYPTGKPGKTALRMSIYVRDDLFDQFERKRSRISRVFPMENLYDEDARAGALACTLWHEDVGTIAIVAAQYPEPHLSVSLEEKEKYEKSRVSAVKRRDHFVGRILENFYGTYSRERETIPDYFFLLGDLGYNINSKGRTSHLLGNMNEMKLKDELKRDEFYPPLFEGKNNEGPSFAPTWALKTNRKVDCGSDPKCYTGIVVGWRDRVLYRSELTSDYDLVCKHYEKLTSATISRSRHNAVMAIYELLDRYDY